MASWLLNSLFDTGSSQSDEPPCSGSEIRCERNASAGCSNTTPDRPPDTGEAGPPATSENLASTRRDWCVHARPMERLQIISALVKDPCGGDSFYHGANFPNRTRGMNIGNPTGDLVHDVTADLNRAYKFLDSTESDKYALAFNDKLNIAQDFTAEATVDVVNFLADSLEAGAATAGGFASETVEIGTDFFEAVPPGFSARESLQGSPPPVEFGATMFDFAVEVFPGAGRNGRKN